MLGPRRIPSLQCPTPNTNRGISIVTSVGFSTLESADYVKAVQKLRPDIVLGMGDVVVGQHLSQKRKERMGDRTQVWVKKMVDGLNDMDEGEFTAAFFAPILPLPEGQQSFYLMDLRDDLRDCLSGLVLYEADSLVSVPQNLYHLPRLCIGELDSPQKVLDDVATGIDILTVPFVGAATDAGIALDFSFPSGDALKTGELLPLGIDTWAPQNATKLSSLRRNCKCFTCTNHHRAYIHHLLNAKEMLGWVLLQLHNHHVMDGFFAGIRQSLKEGSFHVEKPKFSRIYEPQLPVTTGQGPRSAFYRFFKEKSCSLVPRVRGYQFKSEGPGEARKNPSAYESLNDVKEKFEEAASVNIDANAEELEERGFAEKVD